MTVTPGHVTDTELVGMRVGHRAMRADLHRLTETVTSLADSGATTTRARAVADYVDVLFASIENHHRKEDDYLWPLLRNVAGEQVDLGELVEDHTELESMLHETSDWAAKVRTGEPHAMRRLGSTLARLRDLVDEHIVDEERAIFPLITGYVDKETWFAIEKQARKGAQLDFEGPRAIAVTTPLERDQLGKKYRIMVRLVLPIISRRQRRRERAVFGSTPMPLQRFVPGVGAPDQGHGDSTSSSSGWAH